MRCIIYQIKNVFVVYMRLADHKEYKIYQLKDTVEQRISIHRQSLDVQGADGENITGSMHIASRSQIKTKVQKPSQKKNGINSNRHL